MDLIKKVTCEQRLQELREQVKYIWQEGERTQAEEAAERPIGRSGPGILESAQKLEVRGSRRVGRGRESQLQ